MITWTGVLVGAGGVVVIEALLLSAAFLRGFIEARRADVELEKRKRGECE